MEGFVAVGGEFFGHGGDGFLPGLGTKVRDGEIGDGNYRLKGPRVRGETVLPPAQMKTED